VKTFREWNAMGVHGFDGDLSVRNPMGEDVTIRHQS